MRTRRSPFPNRLTLGIDEAGRGPAIGPMVMAAVALDSRAAAVADPRRACATRRPTAPARTRTRSAASSPPRSARARCSSRRSRSSTPRSTSASARGELNVLERELATQADRAGARGATGSSPTASACSRRCARGSSSFESHDRAEEKHAVGRRRLGRRQGAARRAVRRRSAQRYEHELGPITGGGYANAATRQVAARVRRAPRQAARRGAPVVAVSRTSRI